jgi:dihydrofolate reductase
MILAAIVVTDLQNAIGKNNQLLCHLPADLKFFKATTMGSPVIMGRKTYESIGRLLPGRRNIVITRSADYRLEGAEIFHTLETAIKSCSEEKVFIIGGAEIFKQCLSQMHEIYRTVIAHTFDADTYFPEISTAEFQLTWEECHQKDEKNGYDYCFQKWERIAP